jgi:hypothetical protein
MPSILSIVSLDISENHFDGDEGICLILDSLQNHPTLTRLILDQILVKSSLSFGKKSRSLLNIKAIPDLKKILSIPRLSTLSIANNLLKSNISTILDSFYKSGESKEDEMTVNFTFFYNSV